jgi:AcrR family transcriptional regulator
MFTVSTSSYHHGDLRAALIRAGRGIVEDFGPEKLTLREAARRTGVSSMAPYRHFASREALLAAVATEGFVALTAQLVTANAQPEPKSALLGQGVAYVRFAMDHPGLFRLMFGADLPHAYPDLADASEACFAVMAARVAGIMPASVAPDMALACWCLMHGVASLALDGQLPAEAGAPDALAARLAAMLRPIIPTPLVGNERV